MPLALYALALAAFAVGTAEFIIAGLLPTLAADLAVGIPAAGLLVSGYALAVAIGGPILALLTARVPRKPMIVAMIGLFALGQALCAIAPNYAVLMGARILVALTHGLFFGNATIAARDLVSPDRRGAALALVLAGVPVANLLGVPIGAALGQLAGWRFSFWAIGGLAAIAALAVAALLPRVATGTRGETVRWREQIGVLLRPPVALTYLAITVVLIGALAFGTFQVPFLVEVTGVPQAQTPSYLFAYGAGAVLGIFLGGRLADWKLMPSALATLLAFAAVSAAVLVFMHSPPAMFGVMAALGAVGYAFSSPLQTRIVNAAAEAPTLAATFIATAFNAGYAIGAVVGSGILSGGLGYASLPLVGIVCGIAAAGIILWAWALDRVP